MPFLHSASFPWNILGAVHALHGPSPCMVCPFASLCVHRPFAWSIPLHSSPFAQCIPLHDASLCTVHSLHRASFLHRAPCTAEQLRKAGPNSGAGSTLTKQHPGGGSLPHQAPAATPPLPLAPGFVNTELFRHLPLWLKPLFVPLAWLFFRDAAEGAETSLFCATQEGLERFSGRYFADCRLQEPWPHARDDAMARELWEASERLVGLAP